MAEFNSVSIAYFFIPLPEALGLADGYTLTVTRNLPIRMVDSLYAGNTTEDAELFQAYLEISTSIKLWHSHRPWHEADAPSELSAVARRALPNLQEPDSSDLNQENVETTIAELMVPMDGTSENAITDAFDRALRHLRQFQRAYYVVTRRRMTLVTREKLPFFVPVAMRVVRAESDEWPDSLSLMHLNWNVHPISRPPLLDEPELESLVHAMEAEPGYRVFASFLDLWREAANALTQDGNYRAAAVFSAASAEVLFDDLLAHLLWEEESRPESAAALFDGGLSKRVRTHYHSRIGGGGWSGREDGSIQRWQRTVAALRHRVVHGGYEPTIAEVQASLASLEELQSFFVQRLCEQQVLARYPRTAMAFMGRDRLQQMGLWSEELAALQDDAREPHWVSTFARWKAAMQRHRQDAGEALPPQEESANVVAIVMPGGHVSWALHDESAAMACKATEPTLSAEQSASLAELAAQHRNTPEPVSLLFDGMSGSGLAASDWVDEYRLIPLRGVMVNRTDLDPA